MLGWQELKLKQVKAQMVESCSVGLCSEESLRRKLARSDSYALPPLQRMDWEEGKLKRRTPTKRLTHKISQGKMWM